VRRQIRDAERDIETSARRIAEIAQDIERFVPTSGDAFAMTVTGKAYDDRTTAGRGTGEVNPHTAPTPERA
jgi:hypothetical protein